MCPSSRYVPPVRLGLPPSSESRHRKCRHHSSKCRTSQVSLEQCGRSTFSIPGILALPKFGLAALWLCSPWKRMDRTSTTGLIPFRPGTGTHVQKLSKETIAWPTTKDYPCGIWHKGELSTVLMGFLEEDLCSKQFPHEPLLGLLREGTCAINACVRAMYQGDLWLSVEECRCISANGLRFLRRFSELASQAQVRGMNLFMMAPKIHILHKIFLRLHFGAARTICQINPLAVSVQQDEDFIGRPSRLSRRVANGTKTCQRVVERYLEAAYHQWVESGYLVRSS